MPNSLKQASSTLCLLNSNTGQSRGDPLALHWHYPVQQTLSYPEERAKRVLVPSGSGDSYFGTAESKGPAKIGM